MAIGPAPTPTADGEVTGGTPWRPGAHVSPLTRMPGGGGERRVSTAGVPANRLRASGDSASGETWWVSVERAYTDLNPQDRDIVTERCSIGTTAPLTLEEVGRIYGITHERVRQIVAKIPTRLSMLPGVVEAANTLAGVLGDGASFAKLAGAGFDPADPLVALLLELVRGRRRAVTAPGW